MGNSAGQVLTTAQWSDIDKITMIMTPMHIACYVEHVMGDHSMQVKGATLLYFKNFANQCHLHFSNATVLGFNFNLDCSFKL